MSMHYINSDINHKQEVQKTTDITFPPLLSKGIQQRKNKTTENEMHRNEHRVAKDKKKTRK